MPIEIDLMTMRLAVDKVRLPGEPENQGYLNRRTGEVVFVFDTEQDACWASSKKPPIYRTRAEIEASPDEWLRIPFRHLTQMPDLSKSPDPLAELQELSDPRSVKAHLHGHDSLHEEIEEEGDEILPTTLESLAAPESYEKAVSKDMRRRDIEFIKEFLSKHEIEAVLVDVTE